jgi:hypothetical protein
MSLDKRTITDHCLRIFKEGFVDQLCSIRGILQAIEAFRVLLLLVIFKAFDG